MLVEVHEEENIVVQMYDDLTMDELPDPQEEDTKDLYRGVLDAVSARAASNSKADELRKILENPHFQVSGECVRICACIYHHCYYYSLRPD